MIELLIEMFSFDFFLRAMIAWVMLSVVFAYFWNFIVVRKQANIVHTIANFWLLWIAVWLYWWFNLNLSILVCALVWAVIISMIKDSDYFWADSINEILSQAWLVFSIVIISFLSWYTANVTNYLFWDILAVGPTDLWLIWGVWLVVLSLGLIFKSNFLQIWVSKDLAKSAWINTKIIEILFMFLLTFIIAVSIKIIWVLLVASFLIIPANISKLWVNSFNKMIWVSIFVGVLATVLWLIVSYYFDFPSGVSIVLFMIVLFFISYVAKLFIK